MGKSETMGIQNVHKESEKGGGIHQENQVPRLPKKFSPMSSEEFADSIKKVRKGDTIQLAAMTYEGCFVLLQPPGEGNSVVKIMGSWNSELMRGTIIKSPFGHNIGGTGFDIKGENWEVEAVAMENFSIAVYLNAKNICLKSIITNKCKDGIIISDKGSTSRIQSCVVNGMGNGVGIQVDAPHCSIMSTTTNATAVGMSIAGSNPGISSCVVTAKESLKIKEECRGGTLKSNVLNGPASIHGTELIVTSNVGTGGITIYGPRNRFRSNVLNGLRFATKEYYDEGGNIFNYN